MPHFNSKVTVDNRAIGRPERADLVVRRELDAGIGR